MADSVYKVITLIGTSTESWEKAAATAVDQASRTLRDLRMLFPLYPPHLPIFLDGKGFYGIP
jgi:hypothetical protein